jgi:hypothetical protein
MIYNGGQVIFLSYKRLSLDESPMSHKVNVFASRKVPLFGLSKILDPHTSCSSLVEAIDYDGSSSSKVPLSTS